MPDSFLDCIMMDTDGYRFSFFFISQDQCKITSAFTPVTCTGRRPPMSYDVLAVLACCPYVLSLDAEFLTAARAHVSLNGFMATKDLIKRFSTLFQTFPKSSLAPNNFV